MVTPAPVFDHRDATVSANRWDAVLSTASMDSIVVSDYQRLVVVAAHPDDESLGAGGLLATADLAGLDIMVVVATLGEASHPESPTHRPADLARIRRAEVFDAIGALAPAATVQLLGMPDGQLSEHISALASRIRQLPLDSETIIATPWLHDGHPDHAAAAQAVLDATNETTTTVLQYPIWLWHWGNPSADLPSGLVAVPLTPAALEAKKTAMLAHHSQLAPLSAAVGDEAIVPPGFAAHFERDFEVFEQSGATGHKSLSKDFFDEFYGDQEDPWGFQSRWYESRKRSVTLASLPRERFRRGFEPGCSIGVLTAELARRCDDLLATDIAVAPLEVARKRLSGQGQVRLEQRRVPQEWPAEEFDLIVLSEMGYYCSAADLDLLIDRALGSLSPDGILVACHWRHPVAEYPLSGDAVHRALHRRDEIVATVHHLEVDFRLDVFARPPVISVAGASGLL